MSWLCKPKAYLTRGQHSVSTTCLSFIGNCSYTHWTILIAQNLPGLLPLPWGKGNEYKINEYPNSILNECCLYANPTRKTKHHYQESQKFMLQIDKFDENIQGTLAL